MDEILLEKIQSLSVFCDEVVDFECEKLSIEIVSCSSSYIDVEIESNNTENNNTTTTDTASTPTPTLAKTYASRPATTSFGKAYSFAAGTQVWQGGKAYTLAKTQKGILNGFRGDKQGASEAEKSRPYQVTMQGGKFKDQNVWVASIPGLKSGGYTGDWSDTSIDKDNGKLAWLHQKELVLNASDTENMLNAVGLVRDISSLLYNMNTSAFSRATDLMSNLYQRFGSAAGGNSNVIQNINIDADFPGVKDAIQIERAFKNLSNIALQKSSNSTTISNATSTL